MGWIPVMLLTGLVQCSNPVSDQIQPVLMNGEPRFIIGNYYNPRDPAELKIYAENGFNLVRCTPDTGILDMVMEAGLHAWLNTGNLIDFSKEQQKRKEQLADFVNRFKDHPALAVWEVPDEALWTLGYPKPDRLFYGPQATREQQDSILKALTAAIPVRAKGIAEGCEQLKQLDPSHPVWMNHAPRNNHAQLALFSEPVDIAGCDIYPEKEGHNRHSDIMDHSLSAVGGYTDIMQRAAPGKPVWMVLQAFSWQLLEDPLPEHPDPELFPTYKDSRFMAWDAILHGAKGIFYWGSSLVSLKSLFWSSILGVTKEIAALEPFLTAKEMKSSIKTEPVQFTSSVPTRVASTLRKYGEDYLLVILQEDLSQAVDVSGLNFLEGKRLYELTTGRSYLVKNGAIRVWFGKEPHLLCTSKKYEVVHESQFPPEWDDEENDPLRETGVKHD